MCRMFIIIYFLPNASKIGVTNQNEKGGRLKSTGKKINTLLIPQKQCPNFQGKKNEVGNDVFDSIYPSPSGVEH